jgi:hypothetical protein
MCKTTATEAQAPGMQPQLRLPASPAVVRLVSDPPPLPSKVVLTSVHLGPPSEAPHTSSKHLQSSVQSLPQPGCGVA